MKSSVSWSVKPALHQSPWPATLTGMSASPHGEPAPVAVEVELLDAGAAADRALVERLTDLVNRVYAASEVGLWREGATRTTTAEMAGLVAAEEIAVATVDGALTGSIHVHTVSGSAGEFGLLAADPDRRGIGVGRALVAFAEVRIRDRGLRAIRLELLVPRTWRHPSKVFLDGWYGRMGYRVIHTAEVADAYPELAPMLATACEFRIYEKPLD